MGAVEDKGVITAEEVTEVVEVEAVEEDEGGVEVLDALAKFCIFLPKAW